MSRVLTVQKLASISIIWFGLWCLTPGLLDVDHVGSSVVDDQTVLVVGSSVVAVFAVALVLLHRRYSRVLFAGSRQLTWYALPLAAAMVLPTHYHIDLPIVLYLCWTTVSVFWQDYLTFGLLQSYARDLLPVPVSIMAVTALFYLGHALLLPAKFSPTHPLASLGIVALGAALALLRHKLTTMHAILCLHLTFYFIFA